MVKKVTLQYNAMWDEGYFGIAQKHDYFFVKMVSGLLILTTSIVTKKKLALKTI